MNWDGTVDVDEEVENVEEEVLLMLEALTVNILVDT